MALIDTGLDTWFAEYDSCERLSREVREQLHSRDRERPGSTAFDSISAKIRIRLKQFGNEVSQLDAKLRDAKSITADERDRRKHQIEGLQGKHMQLEGLFHQPNPRRNVAISIGTTGWGSEDDDEVAPNIVPSVSNFGDIKKQREQMKRDQDEGLDRLSKVISRQHEVATVIYNELDDQNAILQNIDEGMDRANSRMNRGTATIQTIQRKDSTWGYWLVIILLFIAILAVGFA